ncbi:MULTISPECIES: TetR/AcrR family transcriptional regulator [Saccharothrix]|uniref:TetR/AcrR family transcriptional regulator n=1 Tax=Saccharothrix TaxID=2071 RepID=UPI000AA7A1A7|nr:TetR/AcrR family transcriptional regulator [Saccharothrix sp. CB00851]
MRSATSDLTARARIRDAALARFGADGVAGASMRAIAADAGVSPALVVHHFGSKEGLRQACDEYVLAAMGAGDDLDLAGTTGAALAAGVPQVVCPFVADQPHWAQRAHAIGVAPPPLRQQRLTADTLADALTTAVHDPAFRRRAAEIGALVRAEDGVTRAVAALADRTPA